MRNSFNTIGVFCGSNLGSNPAYAQAASALGAALATANLKLVYGGARVGLMGKLADAMLAHGGHVIGVIPQSLVDREVSHTAISNLHVVASMHERKLLIADLADAFIMLPGACGSLDEFFEVITLAQLGAHHKPCGIINTDHYYDHLLNFLDHMVVENFMRREHHDMILVENSPEKLLHAFSTYQAPSVTKWIPANESLTA